MRYSAAAVEPSPSSQPRPAKKYHRVLIVDDEAPFRRALGAALHSCGYATSDVSSGQRAVDFLRNEQADLVLLDMNMPGLTGLETCRAIREFSAIPVVILSVLSTELDKDEAFAAGANDYITKPFSIRDLLESIQAMLP